MKDELIMAIACILGFVLSFLPLFLFADAGISPLYIGEKTVVSTFVPEGSGIYAAGSRGGGGQQTASNSTDSADGGGTAPLVSIGSQSAYAVDADIPYYILQDVYGTANGSTDWEKALNLFLYDLAVSLDENGAIARLDTKVIDDLNIATGAQPSGGAEVKQKIKAIVKEAKQYKLYGQNDGLSYSPSYVIEGVTPQEKYGYEAIVVNLQWSYFQGEGADSARVDALLIKNNGLWGVIYIALG